MRCICCLLLIFSCTIFHSQPARLAVQTGHVNLFRGDVSKDGKTFVTGGYDGKILKWNLQTGKHALPLTVHKSIVMDIACSPDNNHFYSCGYDGRLIKWSYKSEKPVRVIENEEAVYHRIELIPGSMEIAAICNDSTIRIYTPGLDETRKVKIGEGWPLEISYFKMDTIQGLAVTCSDSSVKFFNLRTLAQFYNFKTSALIAEVKFNPSFTQVALSSLDGAIYALKFPSLEQMRAFTLPVQHSTASGSFSYLSSLIGGVGYLNDSLLLFATADKTIACAETGPRSPEEPFIAAFKQNGFPVQILSVPGTMQVISIHSMLEYVIWEFDEYYRSDRNISMADHQRTVEYVSGISFHPSGKKLLVNTVLMMEYSFEDGKTELRGQFAGAFHALGQYIMRDERIVYSTWDEGNTLFFNKKNKISADTSVVFDEAINCFFVAKNDELIYVVSGGNKLAAVSTADYKIKKRTVLSPRVSYTIDRIFGSPRSKLCALLCSDSVIRIINSDLKVIKELRGSGGVPVSASFSADEKALLTSAEEPEVKIWDLSSGNTSAIIKPSSFETFRALYDASNKHIVTVAYDNVLRLFDAGSLKLLDSLELPCAFNDVQLSPDNKYIVAAMSDGTVGIYHYPSLDPVYSFVTLSGKPDVIPYTHDNYFAGGKFTSRMLAFEKDGVVYPVEQFDLLYNRPDIVLSRCTYADTMIVSDCRNAYMKRLKKYNQTVEALSSNKNVPSVKITNRSAYTSITYDTLLKLNLHAADAEQNLKALHVWVNNIPVFGMNGLNMKKRKNTDTTIRVPLQNGENYIVIKCENEKGTQSYPEILRIKNIVTESIKKNLFVVCIGVSEYSNSLYNLRYAAKDAKDIAELYESDTTAYKNEYRMVLTNKQVTKESLAEVKKFLSKANINDVVIVFMAGHGVLDKQLDYYFATYDLDFGNPSVRGISMTQIEELLAGVKSFRKLLILDSCHSGEMVKEDVQAVAVVETGKGDINFRGGNALTQSQRNQAASRLMNTLFTEMSSVSGTTILASTSGADFAMESDEWKNGLFTYCLLNGLKNMEADRDYDRRVFLDEMIYYLRQKVNELSGGAQAPNTRYENEYCNFRVW